jgi:hypothetical protein
MPAWVSKFLTAPPKHQPEGTGSDFFTNKACSECTPKAVKNRLYSWKKKNVSSNTGLNASTPTKSAASTPKKATPRAKAILEAKKQALSEEDVSSPLDDEELLSPSATRGKRSAAKRSYVESDAEDDVEEDYVPLGKRVKKEVVEEEDVSFQDSIDEEI